MVEGVSAAPFTRELRLLVAWGLTKPRLPKISHLVALVGGTTSRDSESVIREISRRLLNAIDAVALQSEVSLPLVATTISGKDASAALAKLLPLSRDGQVSVSAAPGRRTQALAELGVAMSVDVWRQGPEEQLLALLAGELVRAYHPASGLDSSGSRNRAASTDLPAFFELLNASTEHQTGNRTRSKLLGDDLIQRLAYYYRVSSSRSYELFKVGDRQTTILTKGEWLNVSIRLLSMDEECTYTSRTLALLDLPAEVKRAGYARLAKAEEAGTVLRDNPIYSLNCIDIQQRRLRASFSGDMFARYALSLDLLEAELLDGDGSFPLRDLLLPDIDSVVAPENRVCAGGVVCLFAIARDAAASGRDAADYVLLIQERSGRVINASGQLAVIPKAFHQPLASAWDEVKISTTLMREVEEELLGRDDLETADPAHVNPLHGHKSHVAAQRLRSMVHAGQATMECTAFGFNLVSGNFEFACLVRIDNPEWWNDHSGDLTANWEARRITRLSTNDESGIMELLKDERWSQEGLFSFKVGLDRLLGAS